MKRLVFDLESTPNVADVWGLFNQNVSLNQLRDTSRVICWAAKWVDKPGVIFRSEFHDGQSEMISKAWDLFDEADAIVGWNSASFDVRHMYREFLLAGAGPPSPSLNIDLLKTARRQFRFTSNKLDHVSQQLQIGQKVRHQGHELWTACMAGDAKAWAQMRTYCKHDVVLTEKIYNRLGPWIVGHPNTNLFDGTNGCPACGSVNLQKRGFTYTSLSRRQRFRCSDCGAWSTDGKSLGRADLRRLA